MRCVVLAGVPLMRVEQSAGQVVALRGDTLHFGRSMSAVAVAEAVNYVSVEWLRWGPHKILDLLQYFARVVRQLDAHRNDAAVRRVVTHGTNRRSTTMALPMSDFPWIDPFSCVMRRAAGARAESATKRVDARLFACPQCRHRRLSADRLDYCGGARADLPAGSNAVAAPGDGAGDADGDVEMRPATAAKDEPSIGCGLTIGDLLGVRLQMARALDLLTVLKPVFDLFPNVNEP
jgi:hypothetical protein